MPKKLNGQVKTCLICKQKFRGDSGKYICPDCITTATIRCQYCNKIIPIDTSWKYVPKTCSKNCAKQLRKQNAENTSTLKYGVKNAGYTPETAEKIRQTNVRKYGVEFTFQSEEVKSKIRHTNQQRYGVDNPMQNADIKQKAVKTNVVRYGDKNPLGKNSNIKNKIDEINLEKYGTVDPGNRPEAIKKRKNTSLSKYGAEYYQCSDEGKQRIQSTCMRRYGAKTPFESPKIQQKAIDTLQKRYGTHNLWDIPDYRMKLEHTNMEKYGVPYFCMHEKCVNAGGNKLSKLNQDFGKMLQEYTSCEFEYVIERKQYDFYLPEYNTLIELDPTYSHTTVNTKYGGISKTYHIEKSATAQQHGYQCIHIWDWDDKGKIVKMFQSKTNIYARDCVVKEVSVNIISEFLDLYHLQGNCRGQQVCLGLYYNNELVEIVTFGKPRYNNSYEWELLRLCTKSEYRVVGGASKLFNYFKLQYSPTSIISYCDKSKFTGNTYTTLGFTLNNVKIEPSKHWSKGTKHITDNLLRQKGFDKLFGTEYGKGTSNEQLMLESGWLPVYDCGQATYIWRKI